MKTAITLQRARTQTDSPRQGMLPYGRQTILEEDIQAVVEVLRSDWLTQGPTIERFETAIAKSIGAQHVVACSNGTAALHLAMLAAKIGPGDVVVTTPNTFVADANCARYVGADVQFADIDPATGNMSVESLSEVLRRDTTRKIKAIIAVHFAGQPANIVQLSSLARAHGAALIEDACHALGATYSDKQSDIKVGSCTHSDMTVFSFHPVKHVATGEGGAVSTNDPRLAQRLQTFRTHGITRDHFLQPQMAYDHSNTANLWYYEMQELGYNYRLTDIQAALGISQLNRLSYSVNRRNEIARLYCRLLSEKFPDGQVQPLELSDSCRHAYHLFVVRIDFKRVGISRNRVMSALKERGIGTQVHYIPIHLQPYYRTLYGHKEGDFPNAERYYAQALSLPMYPALTDDDICRVVDSLEDVLAQSRVCR